MLLSLEVFNFVLNAQWLVTMLDLSIEIEWVHGKKIKIAIPGRNSFVF